MSPPRIAFITLTNLGYLEYTLNCLNSLENINFNTNLKCYTIDKKAHKILSSKGFESRYLYLDDYQKFQSFKTGYWNEVMLFKFEIIFENLKNYDYVCYTDGDIVFENKNFLNYCIKNIKEKDFLIQNDTMDNKSDEALCAGFIFMKSNASTLAFFERAILDSVSCIAESIDDQAYINLKKSELNYELLPLELFPNGNFYKVHHKSIKPMMVHFNWIIGHDKAYWILYFKKWQSFQSLIFFSNLILRRKVNRLFSK